MTDPKRWLDDQESLSFQELKVLKAGQKMEPPSGSEDATWAALLASLPPVVPPMDPSVLEGLNQASAQAATKTAAVVGASSAGAGKLASITGGLGVLSLLKSVGVGAIVASMAVVSYQVVVRPTTPTAPLVVPMPTTKGGSTTANADSNPVTHNASTHNGSKGNSGVVVTKQTPLLVENSPSKSATNAIKNDSKASPKSDAIRNNQVRPQAVKHNKVNVLADKPGAQPTIPVPNEAPPEMPHQPGVVESKPAGKEKSVGTAVLDESRLVMKARTALRSGQSGEASRILSELSRRFPRGVLMQEREVLAIELLWNAGQSGAACSRGQQFLLRFPQSPHASRIRGWCSL
jgi:hypothetical protein